MFKVIIAGGREFDQYKLLVEKCDFYLKNKSDIEVVSGKARGADYYGEIYAKSKDYPIQPFPPDYKKYGRYVAPFKRNEQMAQYADALIAFWDDKSTGTKNMIDFAHQYGLLVRVVKY